MASLYWIAPKFGLFQNSVLRLLQKPHTISFWMKFLTFVKHFREYLMYLTSLKLAKNIVLHYETQKYHCEKFCHSTNTYNRQPIVHLWNSLWNIVYQNMILCAAQQRQVYILMAYSRFAPSQWEAAFLCNDVSHWLGASLVSSLHSRSNFVLIKGTHISSSWACHMIYYVISFTMLSKG